MSKRTLSTSETNNMKYLRKDKHRVSKVCLYFHKNTALNEIYISILRCFLDLTTSHNERKNSTT